MMQGSSDEIIKAIIEGFKEYVQEGLFNTDFIGSDSAYYSGGRCHSRVLGILVQSMQRLGYFVDIERSINFHAPVLGVRSIMLGRDC
jgi:hypothetical protein